jgi:Leucine-rich repeat (LRR) protein
VKLRVKSATDGLVVQRGDNATTSVTSTSSTDICHTYTTATNRTVTIAHPSAIKSSLDLSNKNVKDFVGGYCDITSLDLRDNKITTLQSGLFSGSDIMSLDLRDNEISTIQAGAFTNAKINYLYLDGNKLSPVPTKENLGLPNSTTLHVDNQNS